WTVGRKHLSGRADARAAFLSAAGARVGAISHANQGALHVRVGHAPRRRHHGRARPQCGFAIVERLEEVRVKYDVVIVGGGHNGLVAACYLAKGGLKTLVLERRDSVGGGAELDHATGPFSSQIIKDLGLKLELITPKV